MVEDRVTDGKRIAQLLASELTGLETGPLGAVAVTDADPEAEPSSGGTVAYRVTVEGEAVGAVVMYPGRVVVDLGVEESETGGKLAVESGAAVKRAVDAVREQLRGAADG
ncbi:hypothetical protein [Salinirussus salinus]|jgi:hypothetical protein|uniref:hypothetical protein n=1 Tax=Salinirussus salinus TaxID=1198300 RepID=UPI00135C9BA8|nr:hypothetical protein [Salinirussus salinus]